jgi:hypothetical protein
MADDMNCVNAFGQTWRASLSRLKRTSLRPLSPAIEVGTSGIVVKSCADGDLMITIAPVHSGAMSREVKSGEEA